MAAEVFIDGIEIVPPVGSGTSAIEGSSTRRLNRPSQATIRVPNHLAIGGVGSRMKIVLDGVLHHHGTCLIVETNPEEDTGYTVYNSTDPWELWQWRPCRDFEGDTPGNFIDPSFLIRKVSGPQIMEEILLASENPASIPTAAEGPLFLSFGSFETGGSDLSGAPCTWPMTINDMASLLTSTGELDIILTPIDSGGNMAQIDCYNGDFGTDLSGSVIFEYGMGSRNVSNLRWNDDMTFITNKLQYMFGPKETVRRYKGNITGDDPCLPVQFGQAKIDALQAMRLASRTAYGVRMEIQEHELAEFQREGLVQGDCDILDPFQMLERRLWYLESYIRCNPRRLIHIFPRRGVHINAFDIGDLVRVRCTPTIRGGFDGVQRIYEYTVSWNEDGVLALSELQTSADQEGA